MHKFLDILRHFLIGIWLITVFGAFYLYFFDRSLLLSHLTGLFSTSLVLGYSMYLLLGCIRGFTLIPSTYLILLGIAFFPPVPLLILTMAGTLVSASFIYYFAESVHFERLLEHRHKN